MYFDRFTCGNNLVSKAQQVCNDEMKDTRSAGREAARSAAPTGCKPPDCWWWASETEKAARWLASEEEPTPSPNRCRVVNNGELNGCRRGIMWWRKNGVLCVDDLVSRSLTILCQKLRVSLRKLCRWEQLDEPSPASSCAMLLMASMASHTLLVIKHCWTTALEQEHILRMTGKAGRLQDSGVLPWTCSLD